MPVYNSLHFVEESINSVRNQSHKEFELLIIDDASTDGTGLVLKELQSLDSRIRVISLPKNCGVSNARNVGIDLARGSFIAFIDSDDLWGQNKIETQLSFMKKNNHKFTFTEYQSFINSPKGMMFKGRRIPPKKLTYKDLISAGNPIGTSTTMLQRDCIGGVRFKDIGHEDYLFWLNMLKNNNLEALKVDAADPMVFYRLHRNSLSSSKIRAAKWFWNIVRNEEKLQLIDAFWVLCKYATRGLYVRLRNFL